MKVQNMNPAGNSAMAVPPANSAWTIYAHITDDAGHPETIWVGMDTIGASASPANPEFSWGRQDPSTAGTNFTDTTVCTAGGTGNLNTCPTISGSVTAAGLITIKLTAGTPLSFPAPTGASGSAFTWTPRKGDVLSSMIGQTLAEAGVNAIVFGGGILFTVQTDSAAPPGNGSYTMQDNLSCSTAVPIAVLTANPQTGPVSQVFSFNGTSSHEPSGACGTINSYTIDFGDGSATVTNSTGMFTHTYSAPGDYPARLTVKDTVGLTSTNVAQVVVTVTGTAPPLSSVVSRKMHGTVGTFDVPLQKDATTQPRGVECRTGATSGNHTILFTFQNNLVGTIGTDPGMASVVLGPGSVVPGTGTVTGIGPAQNQYTVNLTGVTNANYITVALRNVSDTAGHIGDVATTMGALLGDVTANGIVSNTDVSNVKTQVAAPVTATNFRDDVNANGIISNTDVSNTKVQVGTTLPSTP
jgi:hypothetical protein